MSSYIVDGVGFYFYGIVCAD